MSWWIECIVLHQYMGTCWYLLTIIYLIVLNFYRYINEANAITSVNQCVNYGNVVNCFSLTQLQSQLEQIVKVNSDLRRSNSIQRKQSHTLLEEKSELEAQLADKEQQITKITSLVREQEEKQAPQTTAAPRLPHPSLEVVRTTFYNDSIECRIYTNGVDRQLRQTFCWKDILFLKPPQSNNYKQTKQ